MLFLPVLAPTRALLPAALYKEFQMDRECLYPGHPDTCTPWHYLERDGGRRMATRVLVKVWTHRHPGTTGADLAVLLTLAAHAGPDTTVGLDYEALAAKTGMSFQEATAAVDRLLQRGDLQPASEGWVAVSLNGAAD